MKEILTRGEIQARAAEFAERYKDIKYERQEAQTFYNDLFKVLGIQRQGTAVFERYIKKLRKNRGFIDLFWPKLLLAEHKSAGEDLTKAKEQAEDYLIELKNHERPQCLLICDFQNFLLIDLDENKEYKFKLKDLPENIKLFDFMRGIKKHDFTASDPVSIEAAEIMGEVYKKLKNNGYPENELDYFLTRLTFCLFADDTGIFESSGILDEYLEETNEDGSGFGSKIKELFDMLNKPDNLRQKNTSDELKQFPYIDGNLFNKNYDIAQFNKTMRDEILKASKFDWSKVSPAIFGSLFQSVMEKKQRRAMGAHYTTEENIMKIIHPLFLDQLTKEFEQINKRKSEDRKSKLRAFQNKLGNITFFDPACGSGNFLIIAYREIRRLELKVILELEDKNTQRLDISGLSKIDVGKFYGIEKLEFSAKIAEVSLWMMDHIMNRELGYKFGIAFAQIPLKTSPNIKNSDALEIDWNSVIPSNKCSYILGNPPYGGYKKIKPPLRKQIKTVIGSKMNIGQMDYVTCWFIKAARYIEPKTTVGFVATNSISQGEQVGQFWPLMYKENVDIIFAHESFKWGSEAKGIARVTVIIVGFAKNEKIIQDKIKRRLFYYENNSPFEDKPEYITPYIIGTKKPDVRIVIKTSKPLNGLGKIVDGAVPLDDGNLTFSDLEKDEFLKIEPTAKKWLRPFKDADDFIEGKQRWLLYIQNIELAELKSKFPETMKHVIATKNFRLASTREGTYELAKTPTSLAWGLVPTKKFFVIPRVTSENRDYIPLGYLEPPVITSNATMVSENIGLALFGLLTSRMHMIWTDKVGGKLETRFRYSSGLVYNTFPVPLKNGKKNCNKLKLLAKHILDVRSKHPTLTLEDLYNTDTMPGDLATAHSKLDEEVERLYRERPFETDRERFEFLFKRYQDMIVTGESGPKIGGLD